MGVTILQIKNEAPDELDHEASLEPRELDSTLTCSPLRYTRAIH